MTHFLHLVWVYDAYKFSIDWTLCVKLGKLLYFFFANLEEISKV